MKKYTIKDFVEYNNPCKMCGKNVHLELTDDYKGGRTHKCEAEGTTITFLLQNKYNGNVYLVFDAKKNTYVCSENLETYAFHFILTCPDCFYIKSSRIILEKGKVKPLEIENEDLHYTTDMNQISLYTTEAESWIDVTPKFSSATMTIKTTTIDIPPLFLSKWKTKERLLNLIKTYIAFS